MLKYNQLKCNPGYNLSDIQNALSKKLNIPADSISKVKILKESLDARKKPDLYYNLSVAFQTGQDERIYNQRCKKDHNLQKYNEPQFELPILTKAQIENSKRPIVIGAGPAGLFCAYYLAQCGLQPILFERGKSVDERSKDVETFWQTGILDIKSNVQFGEGGAGTFSDGKLNTLNKDPFGFQKEVFQTFVKFGANEEITYQQKPHLGTDHLANIVTNIRNEIIRLGGEVYFSSQVTDFVFKNDEQKVSQIAGVIINNQDYFESDHIVLAIGHSARDTFRTLYEKSVYMEPKSFAVGYRVQHLQKDIDCSQYGAENLGKFPPAAYKLTAQTSGGRGVYSFCMCPGGYVVNASSENNRLCINGMSYHDRSGDNANSAIIISVSPDDFDSADALSGVKFQETLEEKAYSLCDGRVPIQLYGDFKSDISSVSCKNIKPNIKGLYAYTNLRGIFSKSIEDAFVEGMESFGRKIKGFDNDEVLIAGIEARSSSPVRISRDDSGQSINIKGLYPCGEGAGYAGGITSAACDGINIALKIINSIKEL